MLLSPKDEVIVVGRDMDGEPTAVYASVLAIHDEYAMVQSEQGTFWADRDSIQPRETVSFELTHHNDPGDENEWEPFAKCSHCNEDIDACEDHLVKGGMVFCQLCMRVLYDIP